MALPHISRPVNANGMHAAYSKRREIKIKQMTGYINNISYRILEKSVTCPTTIPHMPTSSTEAQVWHHTLIMYSTSNALYDCHGTNSGT